MSIIIITKIVIIIQIELNFVKHLRIKISERLTQRFDVAMTTLSIDKDKTKN